MDKNKLTEARRNALRAFIAGEPWFGNQAKFCSDAKIKTNQLNDMLNGRKAFGEKVARRLAETFNKPYWFFDGAEPSRAPIAIVASGTQASSGTASIHPQIKEVVSLMEATDDVGRTLALGAVKGALAGYAPEIKKTAT